MKAVYAGSFDPPTAGHLNLIRRGARLFGELIVAVAKNTKKAPLFTEAERVAMLEEEIGDLGNVSIAKFSGLIVDFARERGARVLLRGLRNASDFDAETAMAVTNRDLCSEVESVFLMADRRFAFVSSSLIKEIALCGGDASGFLTPRIHARLRERLNKETQR